MDSKAYLKFSSELNEETKEEYFIPIKSYQRIKKYLSRLSQLEAVKSKSNKEIKPDFAVRYSAFVNALSIDQLCNSRRTRHPNNALGSIAWLFLFLRTAAQ